MRSRARFLRQVAELNPQANLDLISKAYRYAMVAHTGQKRKTGDDYFQHPLSVCCILLDNKIADTATLCAAFLHDIVEDTSITVDNVKKEFSDEIAKLVDGLTKLDKKKFEDMKHYTVENRRKIILATAKDPRVMIIKLCDRLDNMKTLTVWREEKQRRIAEETLRVYVPIAEKLGLGKIKGELSDEVLRILEPDYYQKLRSQINLSREEREKYILDLVEDVENFFAQHDMTVRVIGRAKYFYSIYEKIELRKKTFNQIYDLYAIRIICRKKEACYEVLELLKQKMKFVEGRFKDYIATPKDNGYQSIHANFLYKGSIVEIQIRTVRMDEIAESGIATHWKYKGTQKDKKFDQKINWVKQFMLWLTSGQAESSGWREVTIDVFRNKIITLTPQGDPIILSEGALPLDFAFAVHSGVGEKAVKAKVNGKLVSLQHVLHSGDIVDVVTGKTKTVSSAWLTQTKSVDTAAKIRKSLKMSSAPRTPKQARTRRSQRELVKEEIDTISQLQEMVGSKKIKISQCCKPKRGQKIVAFYTKDKKTITVHKSDCPNQFALDQRRKVSIGWSAPTKETKRIKIVVSDQAGIIMRILRVVDRTSCELHHISSEERGGKMHVVLDLKQPEERIVKLLEERLKKTTGVIDVILDE